MPAVSYGQHSPESLNAIASQLEEFAADLRLAAVRMQGHGLHTMDVAGEAELKRGKSGFMAFIANLPSAISAAREDRGEFNGTQPKAPAAKTKKKTDPKLPVSDKS
jgi:hypothetical protein